MKSRLEVLLRQRELLREHAAWLEAEIAREQDAVASSAPLNPTEPSEPAIASSVGAAGAATADVTTAIMTDLLEPDVRGIHAEVRRGCLLYAAIAAAALIALIGYIYWRY